MMRMVLAPVRQLVLLLVLAVSLTGTAFAHRVPAPQDPALVLALANGATLADFCAGDLDGDGVRDVQCLACQVAGSADLPSASRGLVDLELAVHAPQVAAQDRGALRRVLDPAHRPQGPPTA